MDRESDPVFNARGLLGHEARLQADIRVTTLPEGLDPDEVVNNDVEAWAKIITKARPIVVHVMETLAEGKDLDDPKVKTDIASQVLPLIEDISSPIERDTYRQRLARLLHVDERTLLQENYSPRAIRKRSSRISRPPTAHGAESLASSVAPTGYLQEAYCLGILLRRPDLIYQVDRTFQEAGLVRLSTQDFQHSDHQVILRLIKDSLEQESAEPVDFVLAQLPLSLMDQADQILAETKNLDITDRRVFQDLLRALLDLRRRNTNKSIEEIRYLMEAAQDEGDIKAKGYQDILAQHIQNRSLLDRAVDHQRNRSHTTKDFV
jgi:DNA primase